MPLMDKLSMFQPMHFRVHLSAKTALADPDDSDEVEEEAVLQGTL